MLKRHNFTAAILLAIMTLPGCASMNRTQHGAAVGTGVGSVAGAIIGHQSGHDEGGALIGAAAGAIAGALIGNAEDARDERDAVIARANFNEAQRQARLLTNHDLIRMAQSGVGDDVLVGAVRQQGGRFDLSPDAIIQLHAGGVSDRVITEIQAGGASSNPQLVPVPVPVVPVPVVEEPRVIFVEPHPSHRCVRPRRASITIGHGPIRFHCH